MAINAGTQNAIDQTYRVFYLEETIADTKNVIVFNSNGELLKDAFTANPATDGFPDRAILPVTLGSEIINGVGTVKKAGSADKVIGYYNGDASFAANEAPLRYANVQLSSGFNILPVAVNTALAYGAEVEITSTLAGPKNKYPVAIAKAVGEYDELGGRKTFLLDAVDAGEASNVKIVDSITL
jgi:hypothetical protein